MEELAEFSALKHYALDLTAKSDIRLGMQLWICLNYICLKCFRSTIQLGHFLPITYGGILIDTMVTCFMGTLVLQDVRVGHTIHSSFLFLEGAGFFARD